MSKSVKFFVGGWVFFFDNRGCVNLFLAIEWLDKQNFYQEKHFSSVPPRTINI
jgi:hypothetical protein